MVSLAATVQEPSRWKARAKAVRRRPLLILSLILLVIVVTVAVAGPTVAPYAPDALAGRRLTAPSSAHRFGTDELGRDVLTRVLYGARLSLTIGVFVAIGGSTMGSILGGVAAYRGGNTDLIFQRFIDAAQSIPTLVTALALVSVFGSSPRSIIIAGMIVFIPGASRVIRSTVLQVKQLDYVTAAVAAGAGDLRIMIRHVAPQTMAPYFIIVSLAVGAGIILESGLSFLGLGPPPPNVSWGKMIGGNSRLYIESAPWALLAPAFFLTMVVYAFNLFGDSMRDMLDPKLRGS